jgi:hypothetical protein
MDQEENETNGVVLKTEVPEEMTENYEQMSIFDFVE